MPAAPIEVREHGKKGRDVVVLHGGPGAQGSVASLASALAPKYHVWEPLMRRGGIYPMTMDQHVEDLDAVAPKRAVYVGWSWGAMLGLTFAALRPERVSTLVMVGSGCYDEASREEFRARLRSRLGEEGRGRYDDLHRRLASATDPGWRDSLLGQIGELVEKSLAIEPVGTTAYDTRPDAAGFDETWADVVRLQNEGIEPVRFARIGCPVLMLHGEDDAHPGHSIRESLRPYVPQLAYIGLASCGHVPWYERYARDHFFASLNQWIEGVV